MTTIRLPTDFKEFLKLLNSYQVEYLLIGGYAVSYHLRVKAYVGTGSVAEKLEFLRQRSFLDYLIAEPFEIPKRFHVRIGHDSKRKTFHF